MKFHSPLNIKFKTNTVTYICIVLPYSHWNVLITLTKFVYNIDESPKKYLINCLDVKISQIKKFKCMNKNIFSIYSWIQFSLQIVWVRSIYCIFIIIYHFIYLLFSMLIYPFSFCLYYYFFFSSASNNGVCSLWIGTMNNMYSSV